MIKLLSEKELKALHFLAIRSLEEYNKHTDVDIHIFKRIWHRSKRAKYFSFKEFKEALTSFSIIDDQHVVCLICLSPIVYFDYHGFSHLKENNLLPFI